MSEFRTQTTYADEASGLRSYITGVFTRMGIAVLITAVVAFLGFYSIATQGFMFNLLSSGIGSIIFIVPAIAQFGICIFLSARLMSMQTKTATILLYVYAALTGFTFSIYGLLYDTGTFFSAFAFASVMFFCCAIIGHTTNVDLTKFSGILIGGLIALVIASIASIFIPFLRESLLISYIGIILFLFLTAWDMQKIKGYYYGTQGGTGVIGQNLAVFGAFQLYLDFINIFLYVLRILGSRSRK
ncbi:MAG: Bax inhibitor-1/YccA family protein [Solobacterium sp.]|nr:Bax inhibitor-1/YccA family protein [Solobacterium sp.]